MPTHSNPKGSKGKRHPTVGQRAVRTGAFAGGFAAGTFGGGMVGGNIHSKGQGVTNDLMVGMWNHPARGMKRDRLTGVRPKKTSVLVMHQRNSIRVGAIAGGLAGGNAARRKVAARQGFKPIGYHGKVKGRGGGRQRRDRHGRFA